MDKAILILIALVFLVICGSVCCSASSGLGWWSYSSGTTTSSSSSTATTPTTTKSTTTTVKSRQIITDKGIPDPATLTHKRGWYDVQGQGVANDYCRYVGDIPSVGGIWWSCALAGDTASTSPKYDFTGGPNATGDTNTIADKGYPDGQYAAKGLKNKRGFYTVDGTAQYCRYVGDPATTIWWACSKPGSGVMNPTVTTFSKPSA